MKPESDPTPLPGSSSPGASAWRFPRRRAAFDHPHKQRITIRLDREIIDYFRTLAGSQGHGNYQTNINRALRDYILAQKVPMEIVMGRILNEAFARVKASRLQPKSSPGGDSGEEASNL
jgi:hypothetical protein